MPEDIRPSAAQIPQTGEPTWYPPVEDDAEALRNQDPQNKGVRWVFFGTDGLRAGWSLLLFLLVFVGFALLDKPVLRATGMLRYAPHRGEAARWMQPPLFSHGLPFVFAMIAAWIVSKIEKRRMAQYGLGSIRGRGKQFSAGLVWGLLLFSLLILALWASHLLVFDARLLFGADILRWGLAWAFAFLCVGFSEEYLTRGFLQFTLARGFAGIAGTLGMGNRSRKVLGFWLSALLFSFLFGLGHVGNPGESPLGVWAAGLIGLVFAFSLWRTGSLWWAIGWHAAWDWAESFLYGVADSGNMIQHALVATHPMGKTILSGGLTGPEGSVYVLLTIAVTAAIIAVTLPSQKGSPSDPAYSPNVDALTR